MIYIYILKQDSTPFYVGYSKNPKQRFNRHKYDYGTNIEMEILEETESHLKKQRESYWIKKYVEEGYELKNKNRGGGGPSQNTRSKESIESFREKRKGWSRKGIPQPSTYSNRISESLMYKPKPKGFGDGLSSKTKGKSKPLGFGNKIKESREGVLPLNKYKPIKQYDLENNFIREWGSIKEASECLNLNASSISKVCRGVQSHHKGFKFEFISQSTRICRRCNENLDKIHFSKDKSYCRKCVSNKNSHK
jgi:predicted GIY-YIG superfamily endonuclease